MNSTAPLGYIGLGNIGAPMARRLLKWPGGLIVCDVREEATQPFVDEGARAADLATLGAECAVVSVTVVNDEQVRRVVTGDAGLLTRPRNGLVIAVHSTISDTTAVELAEICAQHGVGFVDAPISGGAGGAQEGTLATMVGGAAADFAAVQEPFSLWAAKVVHAGPVGSGTRMKLARNLLHFIAFTAATEASRLAEAAGVPLPALGDVVRHTDAITGGPGAIMLRDTTAPVPKDDFWYGILSHVRDLGEKDLFLALDLADRLELDLPLAQDALRHLGEGLGVGVGMIGQQYAGKEQK